jgi:hypothetical protein
MSNKNISSLGVTISEVENLIYSAYFQYSENLPFVADGKVHNTFPSNPVWGRVSTGTFEMTTGLGYTFTQKNSQEILVSPVLYDRPEGTNNYKVFAGLVAGTDKIQFRIYDSSGNLSDLFGAFYMRVTVFQ